jgi:hypothetical protein
MKPTAFVAYLEVGRNGVNICIGHGKVIHQFMFIF